MPKRTNLVKALGINMEILKRNIEIAKIREEKIEIWAEEEVRGTVQKVGEADRVKLMQKRGKI